MSFWQVLFSFRGRIGRGPFWAGSGVATVLAVVGVVTGLAAFGAGFTTGSTAGLGVAALVVVVTMLAFLWMTYALLVKRMRDRGKSAWWLLPFLIPLNAALQAESDSTKLGKTIAVQNLVDNIGMLLAGGLVSACVASERMVGVKISAGQVFFVLAGLVLLVLLWLRFPKRTDVAVAARG